MASSTVPPPPPPAPGQGAADAPLPPIESAPAAKKPAARKPAASSASAAAGSPATKPAAATSAAKKPAAKKTAPASSAASSAPAAASSAPAPAAAAPPAARPDPYAGLPAGVPIATPYGAASATSPSAPNPYASLPAAPSSTFSVLSLVFGIIGLVLSLFLIGLLPALAGVILGHLALKREPHARGMAIGGLVTGYVGLAISILWAILFIGLALIPLVIIGSAGSFGG